MARRRKPRTATTRGVDAGFERPGRSAGDSGERVGRPVSELLSDSAGASSPFGEVSLPMPADEIGYQLPGEEEHTEKTEQY